MRGLVRALIATQLFSLSACSGVFYQPDRALYVSPKKLNLQYQELKFKAPDGKILVGWYIPAQKRRSRGLIVQFHGNAENMSSHYVSLVWLVHEGYSLFTFDYEGYGISEGEPSQEATYGDGLAALAQAWSLHEKEAPGSKFVLVGQSLGGAIALRAVDDFPHKDRVDLLVLDSTFLSYRDIGRRKMRSFWLTWIFSPLASLLVSDRYSAEGALERNRIPLLVIHDQRDPAVPYDCGEEIFERARSKKEFWKLDEGRHIGVFSPDHPERRKRFLEVLRAAGQ